MKTNKTRWLWAIATIASLSGGYYYYQRTVKLTSTSTYEKMQVEKADIISKIQATGSVQPLNRLVIKPPINGRIDKVLVKSGDSIKKGQMLAWMSSTDRAALLDAARAQGPEETKHWEGIYRPTPIIAPMAGLIIAESAEPGQFVTVNDQIYVLSDQLMITAQVDETDMAQVKLGQEVDITIDAYASEKIPGKVTRIAFEAKTVNNVTLYDILVEPTKPAPFLRSGMTTTVQFILAEKRDVLTLPLSAIKYVDNKTFVTTGEVNQEGRLKDLKALRTLPVELGISDGKKVEILSGVAIGQEILQENIVLTDPGKKTSPFGPQGPARRKAPKGH
jgi:membrane fusion protein, macrolide-specific efflux system